MSEPMLSADSVNAMGRIHAAVRGKLSAIGSEDGLAMQACSGHARECRGINHAQPRWLGNWPGSSRFDPQG